MRKLIACVLVAVIAITALPVSASAQTGRGGFLGFIAGCCFGIRSAAAYNDGKEIHWREWVMLVPFVNIFFSIWNGIQGAQGITTSDLAARYGEVYY